MHLPPFVDGGVLFSNPGEVLRGFRYVHYPLLLLLLRELTGLGKREGGFSLLPWLGVVTLSRRQAMARNQGGVTALEILL